MKIKNLTISHGRYYKMVSSYVDGKRKQKAIPLSRVEDGETALFQALAKIEQPEIVGNCPARIEEFKTTYLSTLSEQSRKEYGRVYDDCKIALKSLSTEEVAPADVLDILDQLNTPRMKHHYKSRLSTFFRWCCTRRYCSHNPCRDIEVKLPPAKRVQWSVEAWHSIRAKLSPMLQCYMDLCFLLYQRNTDARLLMLTQFQGNGISVTPLKTRRSSGKNVTIQRTPEIDAVLERATELKKGHEVASMYVICKPDGDPYTASGIRSSFDRAQTLAGLSGFTTKSIRPYAASVARRMGYTKEQIQVGLAHTTMSTTEGYLDRHAEAVSAITLTLPEPPKKLGAC
ncbi:MAG: tyrosine-type recombinase/integrase [Burkholderiales bacterium]|jgi:integrase|nr:tyrosine-type recombinase/integrase [Betaproteobacteria bacterium]